MVFLTSLECLSSASRWSKRPPCASVSGRFCSGACNGYAFIRPFIPSKHPEELRRYSKAETGNHTDCFSSILLNLLEFPYQTIHPLLTSLPLPPSIPRPFSHPEWSFDLPFLHFPTLIEIIEQGNTPWGPDRSLDLTVAPYRPCGSYRNLDTTLGNHSVASIPPLWILQYPEYHFFGDPTVSPSFQLRIQARIP